MGIALLDYDNDGWPDLLFSNDTQRTSSTVTMAMARFLKRA